MPTMSFRVPAGLSQPLAQDLLRSSIAGGHDRAPTLTECELQDEFLSLSREIVESGPANVPWEVSGIGRFITPTTTLMFRERPYDLAVELARGKLNQVRNQYAEWMGNGLPAAPEVESRMRTATKALGEALIDSPSPESARLANESLARSFDAGNALIHAYQEQVFRLRQQRQGKLDTAFGCGISAPPATGIDEAFRLTFNTACIPLTWRSIEPTESDYNWSDADAAIDWAIDRGFQVHAGPLIDFSPIGMPEFARKLGHDPVTLKSLMCDYVETAINRYRGKVTRWLITSGANGTIPLGVSEEDLIRLTAMAADAAWQIDSNLQLSFGISSPWGDYLSDPPYEYSPFVYADTLLRAGLPFAGIDLELFMATSPRGSYCRDQLETSRILDMFGMLGVPIQVGLAFPSARTTDERADRLEQADEAGGPAEISPATQADWADAFAALALCKSYVSGVIWDHLDDRSPHRFPHSGLVGSSGEAKPAFDRLRLLRERYLK